MYKLTTLVVHKTLNMNIEWKFQKNLKTTDIYDPKNKMGLSAAVRKEISRELYSLRHPAGYIIIWWMIEKDNHLIYKHNVTVRK